MIEQLKKLLSEVEVNIQQDVNRTTISFSFGKEIKAKEVNPSNDLVNMIGNDLKVKAEQKAKTEIKPELKPKEKPKPINALYEERLKLYQELGWYIKGNEITNGSIGLALTYLEKAEKEEFKRSYDQVLKMKEEQKFKSEKALIDAKSENISSTKAMLSVSPEQQEMLEMQYAVPEDVTYKGKPATPEEAFGFPMPPPLPPVSDPIKKAKEDLEKIVEKSGVPKDKVIIAGIPKAPQEINFSTGPQPTDDLYDVASNPMEQMKKMNGKPYLNKVGILITPDKVDQLPKELSKIELWDNLMKKCTDNKISVDGLTIDEQTVEDIKNLDAWVDEALAEQTK